MRFCISKSCAFALSDGITRPIPQRDVILLPRGRGEGVSIVLWGYLPCPNGAGLWRCNRLRIFLILSIFTCVLSIIPIFGYFCHVTGHFLCRLVNHFDFPHFKMLSGCSKMPAIRTASAPSAPVFLKMMLFFESVSSNWLFSAPKGHKT